MLTFRTVSDSLGDALFFQVDGLEAGYIDQRHDGRIEVFFSNMLDAPCGVRLERSSAPGSLGVYVLDVASLMYALALVRTTYSVVVSTTVSARPDFTVSPRSVPALARNVVRPPIAFPTTDRASFFRTATCPQPLTARNT